MYLDFFYSGIIIHLLIHSRKRREKLHTTKLPKLNNSNVVIVSSSQIVLYQR